jgi:type I restriction enzyme S subunit
MSFPRYPEYKASGVEWLGDVPGHWGVIRLKRVLTEPLKYGANESAEIEDRDLPRFVRITDIDNDGGLREETFKSLPREIAKDYLLEEGDMLLARSGATVGKSFMYSTSWGTACFAGYLIRARLNRTRCFPKWLFFYCQTNIYWAYILGNQIQSTIQNVSAEKYANLILPIPSPYEQQAITNFLDRETAKIDGLIEEQRRLVELLKEKRQAVISHAVTKGLNPNAPMKPSGIEWLGDIPEHWEMKRLAWICTDINDINHEMPKAVDEGVLFLSAKDLLDDGTLNFTNDVKMISQLDYERLSQKTCPKRGDIIYSRIGAALGKARLVNNDIKFSVSYSCCVIRVITEFGNRSFIRLLLDGEMILTEARMRTKGIGVPDLGLGEIGRFPIPLPPISEQERIVKFLENEVNLYSNLISEAEKSITLLQERRTALISAAVTGKIDVRGLIHSESKS